MIHSPLFQIQAPTSGSTHTPHFEDFSSLESFDFFFQDLKDEPQFRLVVPLKLASQNLLKLSCAFPLLFMYPQNFFQETSDFDWRKWQHEIQEMKGLAYTCAPENKGRASLLTWTSSFTQKGKRPPAAIFICGEYLTTQELTFWMSLALQYQLPLILDDEQAMTYSTLWKPGKNCLFLSPRDLEKNWTFCLEKIRTATWEPSTQNVDLATLDDLFNQVSRLYQSASQSV